MTTTVKQENDRHRGRATAHRVCEVGQGCVPGWIIVVLVFLSAALTGVALYAMWAIWPSGGAAGSIGTGASGTTTTARSAAQALPSVHLIVFGHHFKTTSDEQLFAIVAIAGTIGGLVHTLRSLGWYVGNRNLRWSWLAFYVLTPPVAAALATVFYIVARAGLFSPSADTSQVSPFGFAALAGLVGLFAEEAVLKLKKIAESVFDETQPGADHVQPTTAPRVMPPTVSNVTSTAVDVGATVNPGGAETAWKFEYGPPPAHAGSSTGGHLSGSSDQAVHETLTGLTPNTAYQVRLVASNAQGSSVGSDVTFQTLPG